MIILGQIYDHSRTNKMSVLIIKFFYFFSSFNTKDGKQNY